MVEIPIEDLLKQTGSIFKLVNLASRRTIEISEGRAPMVETPKDVKPSTIALMEIAEGKVEFTLGG